MGKALLLFIQSPRTDTYVNVLAHCIKDEGIRDIYFAGAKETTGRKFKPVEFIEQIRNKAEELAKEHDEYVAVLDHFPELDEVESRITWVPFINPEQSIPELKSKFDINELIVDVTGCSKQLAGDVLVSYMVNGINHISYFQLSDKVFLQDWKASRMYHDLKQGAIRYYEYDNFSSHDAISAALKDFQPQHVNISLELNNAVTHLTAIKERLDQNARKSVRWGLRIYFSIVVIVWVTLIVLTKQLGWNTMEPWTYFIGVGGTLGSLAYFVITQKEFSPRIIYEQAIESKKRKNYQEFRFDLDEYMGLVKKVTFEPDESEN